MLYWWYGMKLELNHYCNDAITIAYDALFPAAPESLFACLTLKFLYHLLSLCLTLSLSLPLSTYLPNYRVFIKYCVFILNIAIFLNSANFVCDRPVIWCF